MYAVLTQFTVAHGMWAQMAKSTDQLFAVIKSQKGFKQATFFGDDAAGKYNALILWDSKANADASYAVTSPRIQQGLGTVLKAPPVRQAFETYEPNPHEAETPNS